MKKTMAILCAAAVLCGGLTACSHGSNNSSSSVETPTVEKLAFKLADISMSDSFEDITDISRDPVSGKLLVFGRLAGGSYAGYVTTRTFEEYEEFRFTPQEGELVKGAAMLRGGRKAVLTLLDVTTYVYIYDGDNNQTSVIDCGEVLGEDDYGSLIAGESGVIIDQASAMGIHDLTAVSVADSKVLGEVKLDEDMLIGVSADKDGVPTIVYGSSDKTYTAHIDGTALTDKTECGKLTTTAYSLCAGCGDYSLVANIGSSLLGLRDGEWVEFSNSMDSDFQFYELQTLVMTAQDELAALQYVGAHPKLVLLTAQDISELKSKELVTLVNFMSSSSLCEFDEELKAFNALSEDYRVEYRRYYNEETHERDYEHLRLDIISGDGPDIIPFDAVFTPDSFSSGVFCDLYEYIDADPELSRDDFIPNVREAFERDGKMMMVTPAFQNFMTVTAKAGYPGVRENWSFDDMIAAYNAKPEGMYFFDPMEDTHTRYGLFDNVVLDQFFIDYDKAECRFDSPDYIKMLNFFNGLDIGLTENEYKHLERDDRNMGWSGDDIMNGETFIEFNSGNCYGFRDLFEKVRYEYKDECVFVGYPYDGKESGSFIQLDTCLGIVANSPHKDGAWSFLRYLLSDDYYNDPIYYHKFPVIESRFDEKAQQSVDGFLEFPYDENGKVTDGDMVKWDWEYTVTEFDGKNFVHNGTVKLEPFTQEECDYYKNMIKNANVIRYDGNVSHIVWEEILPFFNGECTAEESAKRIQNRASLYLSERYG